MTLQGLDVLDFHGYADLILTAIRHPRYRRHRTRRLLALGVFFLDIRYGGIIFWVDQAAVSLIDGSCAQNFLPQGLQWCVVLIFAFNST